MVGKKLFSPDFPYYVFSLASLLSSRNTIVSAFVRRPFPTSSNIALSRFTRAYNTRPLTENHLFVFQTWTEWKRQTDIVIVIIL